MARYPSSRPGGDDAPQRGSALHPAKSAKRLQFDFSPGAYSRLQRLQEETEAPTKAEVVRQALRVYEWLAGKALEGKSITISGEGSEEGPIDLRLVIPVTRDRR